MNSSSVELESVECPNGCHATDHEIFVGVDRVQHLPGKFPLVRCSSCGLVRTNPRPTPEAMGFYYPDSYAPYAATRPSQISEPPPSSTKITRLLYRALFKFNTDCLPKIPPGKLLEVGCGSGAFLKEMANAGWQVEGIEFSEAAANNARQEGFSVYAGMVENAPESTNSYDMIVGWWVVEHLHEPINVLKKLARRTKQDGWLVISVPNAGSAIFNIFKGYGFDIHVPNHLYHFSPKTISLVLSNSGWKVERIFHHRVLNSWFGSIGNLLCAAGAPKWLAGFFKNYPMPHYLGVLLYPLGFLLALFGQTGRMTIWARKG